MRRRLDGHKHTNSTLASFRGLPHSALYAVGNEPGGSKVIVRVVGVPPMVSVTVMKSRFSSGTARPVGNEPGGSNVIVRVVGCPSQVVVTVVTSRASTARAVGNAPGGS